MKPADEAANNQSTDIPAVTAPEDMDLSAINAAIAESANAAAQDLQNTFDVENISLDNTPTTDAELAAQQAADPNLSLAGAPAAEPAANSAATPVATPTVTPAPATSAQQAPETAGFVDGDLMDDPAAPATAAAPDYEAIKADPVDSFDESATAANSAADSAEAATPEASKLKQPIKMPKTNLDFNSVLHNNVAIIGIVVGAILILVLALVIIIVLA